MALEINVRGLQAFQDRVRDAPDVSRRAAADAVNSTLRYAYAESSRGIRRQVNLTRDYLGSANAGNRLTIAQRATEANPAGRITGRQRPVSLARFATTRSLKRRGGVSVSVKPGSTRQMASAFLLKLKAGASVTQDAYNLGLAVRLKPGQPVFNKRRMVKYSADDPNLYLLYGPSVDQIFRDVREEIADDVEAFLANEYLRQYERYIRG